MSIPVEIAPMLARDSEPFDSSIHLFETKWDGFRCLAFITPSSVRLQSRNLKDITGHYPELAGINNQVDATEAVLDGELVCMVDGKPSFQELQRRIRTRSRAAVKRQASQNPVVYVVFDLLYLDGRDLCPLPLTERKELLKQTAIPGDCLTPTTYVTGKGKEFFRANVAMGMEGVVAKQLDSPYLPGHRSHYWLKIKRVRSIDAIIVGYIPKGKSLRSLALGAYLPNGILVDIGLVGSGIGTREEKEILPRLERVAGNTPPVDVLGPEIPKTIIWTRPQIVCSVEYLEFTYDGRLRHPRFVALRTDKSPVECVIPPEYVHIWLEGERP